jgi:hypothetical protein
VNVIIGDRVPRGVFVEDEQRAEAHQQQSDPVAWLAPDDQPSESSSQDPE